MEYLIPQESAGKPSRKNRDNYSQKSARRQVTIEQDELDELMSEESTKPKVDNEIQAKISEEQAKIDQLMAEFETKLHVTPREEPSVLAEADAFIERMKDQDRRFDEMEK